MHFVHDNWSCCNILYIIYRIQFHSIPSVFLRSLMPSAKSQRGLNRQKSHAICGTLRLWSWHRRKGGHGRNILDPGKQVSSRTCGCWETPSDRFHVFFLWLLSSNQPPYTLLCTLYFGTLPLENPRIYHWPFSYPSQGRSWKTCQPTFGGHTIRAQSDNSKRNAIEFLFIYPNHQ